MNLLSFLLLLQTASAFVVPALNKAPDSTTSLTRLSMAATSEKTSSFFTGGAFDKQEDTAIQIASKLKSVRDLGWTTNPPKRKGSTRPRHRAFGGQSELPVQLKPNYDESNPMCVEKWLTQDEFYRLAKKDGPAADTVFVALAGGAAYAERDSCEKLINNWNEGKTFNKEAFLASVKKGRTDLATGWTAFLTINVFCVSCIAFPTSPVAKGLEKVLGLALGVDQ